MIKFILVPLMCVLACVKPLPPETAATTVAPTLAKEPTASEPMLTKESAVPPLFASDAAASSAALIPLFTRYLEIVSAHHQTIASFQPTRMRIALVRDIPRCHEQYQALSDAFDLFDKAFDATMTASAAVGVELARRQLHQKPAPDLEKSLENYAAGVRNLGQFILQTEFSVDVLAACETQSSSQPSAGTTF